MTDERTCLVHEVEDCQRCPRYEFTVDWGAPGAEDVYTSWFYVGQDGGARWGYFGDGVWFKYVPGTEDNDVPTTTSLPARK